MKKIINNEIIFTVILILSISIALAFSYKFDKNLYIDEPSILETVDIKTIEQNNNEIDTIEIKYDWQIAIPKLDNLIAPIREGSDTITLSKYVGHIEGTALQNGNIALAGHNNTRNYQSGNFYFDKLDELDIGDKVYYTYYNTTYSFKVREIKEVNEKELSVLEESEASQLTLVTCIQGKYRYRLIVICDLI
ncbi:MAG: sortase [Clostridia bacterium]|nr:sortase [Clostridia bacterium]